MVSLVLDLIIKGDWCEEMASTMFYPILNFPFDLGLFGSGGYHMFYFSSASINCSYSLPPHQCFSFLLLPQLLSFIYEVIFMILKITLPLLFIPKLCPKKPYNHSVLLVFTIVNKEFKFLLQSVPSPTNK